MYNTCGRLMIALNFLFAFLHFLICCILSMYYFNDTEQNKYYL